jgi:sigma-B regulation protein RsbU (phosphoserine phosphatase)
MRTMPVRSQLLFFIGTFFLFVPTGLLTDVSAMGRTPVLQLTVLTLIAGGATIAYVLVARYRQSWIPLLLVVHIGGTALMNRAFGPFGPPLGYDALKARLGIDVVIVVLSLVASFVVLSRFVRVEAGRYGRLRAEVDLARQIHRVLVPPLAQRIGGIEVRGLSVASGDVGGDLVDMVETAGGQTAYVVDVSGHGVASGLLMGMVKSAARVALRGGSELGALLTVLNRVIFDLKSPAMYATFAGLQWRDGALSFAVAAHAPILRHRHGSPIVDELTMTQLPIAMFEGTAFAATPVDARPGDLFVILTDGLTEVFDAGEQEFGLERMKAIVAAHADGPLEILERQILAAARGHGPQLDDQSLLLVRVL